MRIKLPQNLDWFIVVCVLGMRMWAWACKKQKKKTKNIWKEKKQLSRLVRPKSQSPRLNYRLIVSLCVTFLCVYVAIVSCLQYSKKKLRFDQKHAFSSDDGHFDAHIYFFCISFSLDTECSCTSEKKIINILNIEKKEGSKQPTQHTMGHTHTHTTQVRASIYADFSTVSQIAIMKMKRAKRRRERAHFETRRRKNIGFKYA